LNAVSRRYNALVRDKQSAEIQKPPSVWWKKACRHSPSIQVCVPYTIEIESQLKAVKQTQKTPIEPQPIAKKPKNIKGLEPEFLGYFSR